MTRPKRLEVAEVICRGCGDRQQKVQHARFPSQNKRWRSFDGGMWCGKYCPKCHRENMKNVMREKRAREREAKKLAASGQQPE
jgi:bacterioferritin-associated ferredoxin